MQKTLMSPEALKIINQVGDIFQSFPHLPQGIRTFLVKIAPYMALIGGVLTLVSGPLVGIIGGIAAVLTLSPGTALWTVIQIVVTLLSAIMLLMAYKPLKSRQFYGWVLLFWVQVLSGIQSLLGVVLSSMNGGIISALLSLAISFYILFETRSAYDNTVIGEIVDNGKRKK